MKQSSTIRQRLSKQLNEEILLEGHNIAYCQHHIHLEVLILKYVDHKILLFGDKKCFLYVSWFLIVKNISKKRNFCKESIISYFKPWGT